MNEQNKKQNKIRMAEINFSGQTGQYIWMYHRTVGLQAIRRITQTLLDVGLFFKKPVITSCTCTTSFNIQCTFFPHTYAFSMEETTIISL
jgi:hypothetical protein